MSGPASVRLDPAASLGALGVGSAAACGQDGPPAQLGRHTVLHLLGRGGMGEVYEAVDARLLRRVAVKVLLPGVGSDAARRLVAESQVTGQLEHPNIVPAHELGIDEHGRVFYTMKLVRGESLAERIDRWGSGPLTAVRVEEIVTIVRKLCDAMAFAHARGVVHRDLKPGNVMLGEYHEVLVADWGLARVADGEDLVRVRTRPAEASSQRTPRTLDGLVVGTPAYMAPEQARGENAAIGPACDVYSLGAILYHMLTGCVPVDDEAVDQVLKRVAAGDIVPAARRAPRRRIPAELAAVVAKAMAADPAARYAGAAELEADLAAFLALRAVSAHRESAWAVLVRLARRSPVAATALLLAVGLGVAGLAYALDARTRARIGVERAALAQAEAAEQARRALVAERARGRVEEEASAAARRRVEALPAFTEASDLLLRGQLPERAAALLSRAVGIDPGFVEAHYALGQARLENGDSMEAAEAFLAAAGIAATGGSVHLPALLAAARVLEDCGDYARAEDAYRRVVAADPQHPLGRTGQALVLAHYGRYEPALAIARQAAESAPHLWETHHVLGQTIRDSVLGGILPPERIADAIASMRRALVLGPDRTEVIIDLADVCEMQGDPGLRREAEALRARVRQRPAGQRSLGAIYQAASAAVREGRIDEAKAARATLIGRKAPAQLLNFLEAKIRMQERDFAGACEHLRRILAEGQPWPGMRCSVLVLLARQGVDVAAELASLRKEHPEFNFVYHAEIEVAIRRGDLAAVIAAARDGLRAAPYDVHLHRRLVRAMLKRGDDAAGAVAAAERAVAVLPGIPEIRETQVLALLGARRLSEAAAILAEHRRRFPARGGEADALQAQLDQARKGNP